MVYGIYRIQVFIYKKIFFPQTKMRSCANFVTKIQIFIHNALNVGSLVITYVLICKEVVFRFHSHKKLYLTVVSLTKNLQEKLLIKENIF
jgi:hypothetical protein